MIRKVVKRSEIDFKFSVSLEKEIEILGTTDFDSKGLKSNFFCRDIRM